MVIYVLLHSCMASVSFNVFFNTNTAFPLTPHPCQGCCFSSFFIIFALATKFAVHYQVVLNIQFTQNVVNICHKHSNDVYDFRYHFGSYATTAPLLLLLRFMKSQRILQSLFSTSIVPRTYS